MLPSPRRALVLALALAGCVARSAPPAAAPPPDGSGPLTIQVRVDYRQRVALPPTAVVRVQLQDVARADAPARVLAEETLTTQGAQVPFAFTLRAAAADVAPPARPVLRARIEVDGQLRFTNPAAVPVPVPPPARPIEVVVQPAT